MNLKRRINKIRDRRKFTLEKYREFLQQISEYDVVTCDRFRFYHNPEKVVICIRHDVDSNLTRAYNMLMLEKSFWIPSTYFLLHTAKYFDIRNKTLRTVINESNEIGIHNNIYQDMDSFEALLSYMRQFRIVVGTAAHGCRYVVKRNLNNRNFWKSISLKSFGLQYEAYSLDYTKYYSDSTFVNLHRWHPDMMPEPKPGDRIQILIHPEHWK